MSSNGFDFSELDDFSKDLLNLAQDFDKGKQAKAFLRKSGNKLKKATVKHAKTKVKKKTGNLYKSIKRGKPYKYSVNDAMAVRVYGINHAHLLNNGHRIVAPYTKEEKGFAKGYHFFESGASEYEQEWTGDVEDFIDEMLNEHGMS